MSSRSVLDFDYTKSNGDSSDAIESVYELADEDTDLGAENESDSYELASGPLFERNGSYLRMPELQDKHSDRVQVQPFTFVTNDVGGRFNKEDADTEMESIHTDVGIDTFWKHKFKYKQYDDWYKDFKDPKFCGYAMCGSSPSAVMSDGSSVDFAMVSKLGNPYVGQPEQLQEEVIAWLEEHEDGGDHNTAEPEAKKHAILRHAFESRLVKRRGVVLEHELSDEGDVVYAKVHIPFEICKNRAQYMQLRKPLLDLEGDYDADG